eukprot:superscaffoldBa00006109_g21150
MQRNGSRLLSCPMAVAQVCSRGTGSTSPAPGTLSAFHNKPRTVEDLPHTSFSELIYRMVFQGFYNRLHELQIYQKQLYGPIYRDGMKTVCLNTAKLLEELMRNDEKFPCRGDMSFWKEYRDMKGFGYGPFTEEGERWYNLRVVLNKRMLHPKDSAQYGSTINDVVTDFTKRVYYVRQCSTTGDLVTNLANELYQFSLEGIASILFETRIGCLEKEIPAGTQDFINAIAQMFSNSMAVIMAPKWSRNLLPYWGRYIAGWEGIFSFAKELIDKKMEVIQQRIENSQDVEGEYLTYLLSNTQMSTKDIYGSIAELLLAGVDTTPFTICHYAISHDEETFPEPFTFKPERWLRDGQKRPEPFGSIPFGFGVRSCVGRRIAELEMYMVLFRIYTGRIWPFCGPQRCLRQIQWSERIA